jgi:hypothetical protein
MFRQRERQQDCLKNEGGASGAPLLLRNVEEIFSTRNLERRKSERSGGKLRALDPGAADRCSGLHCREMLGLKAGLLSAFADVGDFNGLFQNTGEGERGAEDLSTALAVGAVDVQEF